MLGKSDWNSLKIEVSLVLLERAFNPLVATGKPPMARDWLQNCLISLLRTRAAQMSAELASRMRSAKRNIDEAELLR